MSEEIGNNYITFFRITASIYFGLENFSSSFYNCYTNNMSPILFSNLLTTLSFFACQMKTTSETYFFWKPRLNEYQFWQKNYIMGLLFRRYYTGYCAKLCKKNLHISTTLLIITFCKCKIDNLKIQIRVSEVTHF